jgi:hypothetical protein
MWKSRKTLVQTTNLGHGSSSGPDACAPFLRLELTSRSHNRTCKELLHFSVTALVRHVPFGMASYPLRINGVGGGQERADDLRQLREALVLG